MGIARRFRHGLRRLRHHLHRRQPRRRAPDQRRRGHHLARRDHHRSGYNLVAGTVLGKIRGTASSAALGTNTGNGTMGAVTLGAGAMEGDYKLTIIEPGTNVGNFVVEDPLGRDRRPRHRRSAFSGGGLRSRWPTAPPTSSPATASRSPSPPARSTARSTRRPRTAAKPPSRAVRRLRRHQRRHQRVAHTRFCEVASSKLTWAPPPPRPRRPLRSRSWPLWDHRPLIHRHTKGTDMATMDIFKQKPSAWSSSRRRCSAHRTSRSFLGSLNIFTPSACARSRRDRAQGRHARADPDQRARRAAGRRRREKRDIRDFRTVRIAKGHTLTAAEIQNIRAFGSETELQQVQNEIADIMDGATGLRASSSSRTRTCAWARPGHRDSMPTAP
jgi:hypothetical protein